MKKRYLILLSTLFIAFTTAYVFQNSITNEKSQKTCAIHQEMPVIYDADPQTYAYYAQDLQELEQEAWDALEQAGVSKDACLMHQQELYQEYLQELADMKEEYTSEVQFISTETRALVHEVLQDFNLSPDAIELIPWDVESAEAAATDTSLFINEETLNKHTPAGKKFIIAHELQHKIHQDSSIRFVLTKLGDQLSIPKSTINILHRFFETRADTLAALKNDDYAQGHIECMQKLYANGGDGSGTYHPKASSRLARGEQIVAMKMQNTQPTTAALA